VRLTDAAAGGQPPPRKSSRAEHFQCSRENITKPRKNPKTYGRFLGTIFGGGAGTLQVVSQQGLASRKIPKNEKNTKNNVLFFARTPRFSAKQARFGAVFGCQTITHSASGFP